MIHRLPSLSLIFTLFATPAIAQNDGTTTQSPNHGFGNGNINASGQNPLAQANSIRLAGALTGQKTNQTPSQR